MFIGHLPGGYLAARAAGLSGAVFTAFVVGSVLPDLDMLWFYLVDGRQHHHHSYITHRPIVWVLVASLGFAVRKPWVAALGLGALLHCALDTVAGAVMWAWPISDRSFTLVTVPATYDHWVLSFLTHWTFYIEIAICLAAAIVLLRRRRREAR